MRLTVGDEALVAALGYFQPSLLEVTTQTLTQNITIHHIIVHCPGHRAEECGGDGQRRGGRPRGPPRPPLPQVRDHMYVLRKH